jgi:hypothetical protein
VAGTLPQVACLTLVLHVTYQNNYIFLYGPPPLMNK